MYGSEMRLACDNLQNVPFEEPRPGASYLLLKEKLCEVQENAALRLILAKERQKNKYYRNSQTRKNTVGDTA